MRYICGLFIFFEMHSTPLFKPFYGRISPYVIHLLHQTCGGFIALRGLNFKYFLRYIFYIPPCHLSIAHHIHILCAGYYPLCLLHSFLYIIRDPVKIINIFPIPCNNIVISRHQGPFQSKDYICDCGSFFGNNLDLMCSLAESACIIKNKSAGNYSKREYYSKKCNDEFCADPKGHKISLLVKESNTCSPAPFNLETPLEVPLGQGIKKSNKK